MLTCRLQINSKLLMSRCDCFGFSPATDMKEIYFQELPHHFPGVMSFNWSQWPGFLPSSVAKPSGTHVLWAPLTPQLCWMTHPALPVALVGKSSPLASVISVNVEQGKSNTWAKPFRIKADIPLSFPSCVYFITYNTVFTLLILVYSIAEV